MERLRLTRYDPVIYCYELQLHPSVHRKGLGKRMMQMLELVVSRVWGPIHNSGQIKLPALNA
jgi:GNAT superfamily N-acetyltransferase